MTAQKSSPNSGRDNSVPEAAASELSRFEKEIERQEDLLYGVALFFEGISLLHAGQDALIETYRKHFRNVIQTGKEVIQQAQTLLEQAKKDPAGIGLLREFKFSPCKGYLNQKELAARAGILVETYNQLFPGRPRAQPFKQSEVLRLIEAAAIRLD